MDEAFRPRRIVEMSLAKRWGVDTYVYLMQKIQCGTDISKDTEFQRKFTGFYRLRRNGDWRTEFYDLFEQMRRSGDATFPEIISALKEKSGRVETSFSSKMLHSLKPEMPIWDKNVRLFFGLNEPAGNIDRAITYYTQLVEKFNAYSESAEGRQCVEEFDRVMPSFSGISREKKVDFFVWATADLKQQETWSSATV